MRSAKLAGLTLVAMCCVIALNAAPRAVLAQPASATQAGAATQPETVIPSVKGLTALNKQQTVFLDPQQKKLVLQAKVAARDGLLEMLLCLKQTKEHESILTIDSNAQVIHAGLLALGVEPGKGVSYNPVYRAPAGPVVKIFVSWKEAEGGKEHRVAAQTWVRHVTKKYFTHPMAILPDDLVIPDDCELRHDPRNKEILWYGHMTEKVRDRMLSLSKDASYQKAIKQFYTDTQFKELIAPWVFTGSGFQKDPQTGEKFYMAEGGDVICVANFSSALIDLAARSSATNESLDWESYTERIPSEGTPVTIELIPELPAREEPKK